MRIKGNCIAVATQVEAQEIINVVSTPQNTMLSRNAKIFSGKSLRNMQTKFLYFWYNFR